MAAGLSCGAFVPQAAAEAGTVAMRAVPNKAPAQKKFSTSPAPKITGKAKAGKTLKADAGKWSPVPDSLSYQWYRSGVKVNKATKASYTVTKQDLGKQLSVKVTAKKAGYQSLTKASAAVKVGKPAAAKTATLTNKTTGKDPVKAAAKVGNVLTVKTGSWGKGVSLSYQWYRSGVKVNKATKASYTLTKQDKGKQISVKVTGKKAGVKSVTKTSKASKAVVAKAAQKKFSASPVPTITGTAKVGQILKADAGKWSPAPKSLSYQWYRSGVKIAKATKASYTLTSQDEGKQLSVKVTAKKAGYASVTKASVATGQVVK
ncbi:MAG: hypothetical protein LBI99_00250 [Propionibacteriaceae bacterium]|nr:hypothetical protein [Propionibacteriaceae bacterium]